MVDGPYRMSPTRLFKGLMLSSAGITSRLDRLEKRALVRRLRDPNDRRGVMVELTEEGRSVLEHAVQANTAAERELVADLGPAELETLAVLLKKVLARLETQGDRNSWSTRHGACVNVAHYGRSDSGGVRRMKTVPESAISIAERLTQLGFSQYEARTYVGLLMSDGATGYGIANDTGVPQPKVYETLRRLVDRGAAVLTAEHPARYAAVPPSDLLAALQKEFGARLEAARTGLESLPLRAAARAGLPLARLDTLSAATRRAVDAIATAHTRVYISGRGEDLKGLAEAIDEASGRGVQFVIVHFGRLPFVAPRGKVMRHASTEGTIYASRKTHHLAVVVDSRWALWALARDGHDWEVMHGEVPLVASLVKSYIRHDLFVQRMYADLPNELEGLYGPGLLQLSNLSGGDWSGEGAPETAVSES